MHIESLREQPAVCMHAKSSLASAYAKLGCSYFFLMYMSIKLSKLMFNPLCSNPCRVISRDAVNRSSLSGYYDLYGLNPGPLALLSKCSNH